MALFPLPAEPADGRWSEAASVLRAYAEAVQSAPNKLAVDAGMLCGPDGSPMLFLAPLWTGERSLGEEIMAYLQSFGSPILVQTGSMTCQDLLGIFDAYIVDGCCYSYKTRHIRGLTPEVIAALIAAGTSKTSPFAAIFLHHFAQVREYPSRIRPSSSAVIISLSK